MYFTEQALADLRREFETVPQKLDTLQERYLIHEFRIERAKEFAQHGFVRRLKTLARCIENVFTLIPLEQTEALERDIRNDAEINIQASIFNVFAAVDNLAWIWVSEKAIRRTDGRELPDTWIGLRNKNRIVRESLPNDLREHITGMDDWFDMLDNYRHALAHRIPLYIPPYCVDPANEEAYADIETQKLQIATYGDLAEYDRLCAEQRQMQFFRPWMQHSFVEGARPLVFHPQLLANFNTIEELGRKVLDALNS